MKRLGVILTIFIMVALLGESCKKKPKPTSPESYNKKEMLTNVVTNYIIPAYDDYQSKVESLHLLLLDFVNLPTEVKLNTCRGQWKEVALAWQNIAMFEFGPASNISFKAQTNIYPTDTALIQNSISLGTYDLQLPSNFKAKGIQAIDYLLFLPNKTDVEIVNYYLNNTNAKDYLTSVSQELKTNALNIYSEWSTSYQTTFINNSESNASGSSVSNLLNALSLHYETYTRKGKVGIPLGVFNGISQQALPHLVEATYSDFSKELLIQQMKALKKVIKGTHFSSQINGDGFDDYLDHVKAQYNGENLSMQIISKIDAIIAEVENLNGTLKEEIINNQSQLKNGLYTLMQQLVPLIKVEMTSALGVQITYQDTDGD